MRFIYKEQSFQTEAAQAVCDVFAGQTRAIGDDGLYLIDQGELYQTVLGEGFDTDTKGWRNVPISPALTSEMILHHIQDIQRKYLIEPSTSLVGKYNLTVEMETGTGKTFTYTKTMFELNKRYGWSKFIVVVPSIAIREGVYKSFQSTQDYFADMYGKKLRFFIYNSSQLSKIQDFANGHDIHVMIINSQAFNAKGKDARRIYMELDEFQSRKPIDVIAATHPIVIIDEPQSVEGKKTKEHLKDFHPLFTLRYSATPKERYNLIYRLDALDAYNRKIVKKISVKGISATGSTATESYVYVESINLSKDNPTATISFDVKMKNGVKKKSRIIHYGDNLYEYSGELEEYKDNFIVKSIDGRDNTVEFLNGLKLTVGEVHGSISEKELRRLQIRETILSHLERERQLYREGIKVLSLFFIDEVAHYRKYDENGQPVNGEFADIFEEEYQDILDHYQGTLDPSDRDYETYLYNIPVEQTHTGYFSIDKKGKLINGKINKKEQTSDDADAYDLIMKDKERLLSFAEPMRFIFSHSALREGWDNPNVFQICTLKNSSSETRKRQEVGRGMRLCVDQDGNRMDAERVGEERVQDVNTLTVIASESYESFAKGLQSEMAEAVSDRPQVVDQLFFIGKSITLKDGSTHVLNSKEAADIYRVMIQNEYVDSDGHLTEKYLEDKKQHAVKMPESLHGESEALVNLLNRVYNAGEIKPENARSDNVTVKVQADKLEQKEFKTLWNRIHEKTVYEVSFNSKQLIDNAVAALDKSLNVPAVRYVVSQGEMEKIDSKDSLLSGTAFREVQHSSSHEIQLAASRNIKYDLVGKLVSETGLTRRDIISILQKISKTTFDMFKNNPEAFIIRVAQIINEQKANEVIDHITYRALEDSYSTDIFFEGEKRGRLDIDAFRAKKSLYSHVVYDSDNEKKFAEKLDTSQEVAVYVKLPSGFFISTPVGKYNPDWAIAFHDGDVKHIYFVAETKGNVSSLELRKIEDAKTECATKHFAAISNDTVKYSVVDSFQDLMEKVMK